MQWRRHKLPRLTASSCESALVLQGGRKESTFRRLSQSVVHINPEVPPKVDAAAEIRLSACPAQAPRARQSLTSYYVVTMEDGLDIALPPIRTKR